MGIRTLAQRSSGFRGWQWQPDDFSLQPVTLEQADTVILEHRNTYLAVNLLTDTRKGRKQCQKVKVTTTDACFHSSRLKVKLDAEEKNKRTKK